MGNDTMVLTIAALWFMFVSRDWKTIYATSIVIMILAYIIAWTIPESPRFLVAKARYDEARSVLTKIARNNCVKSLNFNELEDGVPKQATDQTTEEEKLITT